MQLEQMQPGADGRRCLSGECRCECGSWGLPPPPPDSCVPPMALCPHTEVTAPMGYAFFPDGMLCTEPATQWGAQEEGNQRKVTSL